VADERVYPLFLRLDGRRVLVVGGGSVAARKIADLVDAGAAVHVVAPGASDDVSALARSATIRWDARPFDEGDVRGSWLVVAATDDPAVQRAVFEACEAAHVFCVAVDDVPNASAFNGSVVRRDPFAVAISSSGAAPALTRLVREIIEHVLPEAAWVERARALRARWKAEGAPMESRFAELVREIAGSG